ncbi:Putative heat shock protein YegD [Salmonella enterica subsp. arizonae]|uniref:Heat shock protein YegD n=1 Tax=Salmonella enterica subsp. arizonae TaxID=59203 RepID=A0A379SKE3_SALER|nr:Putative heat shock protein YegD [Salmonella enterica subsp. arizonae]
MFIGFDYGTANCSVAIMRNRRPQLLTMENNSTLLPSMLCAPTREAVSEWLYRHYDVPTTDEENPGAAAPRNTLQPRGRY